MNTPPQKILKNRYQVVPRTLILIFNGDNVLLQKGSADKRLYPGMFNGLGGHIEKGEDILTSARRELFEEAGIISKDLKLAGTVMIDVEETQGILMFVFTGTYPELQVMNSIEGDLHWVKSIEIGSLNVVEDIPEMIKLIQKFNLDQKPFFGHYAYSDQQLRIFTLNYSG
jgi:8-oxo-dGTP diphosphatase